MPPDESSAKPATRRPLPRRFGRYSLFDFIGKGGMAEIFLARAVTDFGGARLCVVKQIIPEFAEHPDFAAMLIHEAKLAAQLNHANIVQVFDLGRDDDQLFIAMEYVEGYDLNGLLRQCTQLKVPMPMEFALCIVSDVLKALDYAHRRTTDEGKPLGIVHRDVSPSNVLLSLEGEVKLCDFGIAHANELVTAREGELDDAIKGKAGYMSPEHARGEAIDARADVFAAGIVLWELMAGRRFYRNDKSMPTLLEQARRAEVRPLPDRGLPNAELLQKLLDRALARDRDERFPTAAAMLRELEGYMAASRLVASPLKLGEWMIDRFGTATVKTRRARERAAQALERGPAAVITPIYPAPSEASAPDTTVGNVPSSHDVLPASADDSSAHVKIAIDHSGASMSDDARVSGDTSGAHAAVSAPLTMTTPAVPRAPGVSGGKRIGIAAAIALAFAVAYALVHGR